MYGETTQSQLGASGYAADSNTIDGPLTAEIMQRTTLAAEQASQIVAAMWSLRDRLFGPASPLGQANGANPAAPQAFADAWRGRSGDLLSTLDAINRLTSELSNRL